MKILSIDTSCDETSVAITEGRTVISHVEYTQIATHSYWGGVVPSLAKRAHEERIDGVINRALKKAKENIEGIDVVAITIGPGLAIALEVGIKKAKEISIKFSKPIIAINHMEGHIYSCFVQNINGNPKREFKFPYLAILASGGHTELVLFKNHLTYEIIGKTRDDAIGESLDKASRMLGFGYPGGSVIEKLSEDVGNIDYHKFPRPMQNSGDLDFSYSGLKTSFFYYLSKMSDQDKLSQVRELASSYQEASFGSLIGKIDKAIVSTGIKNLVVGGGVAVNKRLRYLLRNLVLNNGGSVIFPSYKYLNFDNASMIGVAAYFKALRSHYIENLDYLDRLPRLSLG